MELGLAILNARRSLGLERRDDGSHLCDRTSQAAEVVAHARREFLTRCTHRAASGFGELTDDRICVLGGRAQPCDAFAADLQGKCKAALSCSAEVYRARLCCLAIGLGLVNHFLSKLEHSREGVRP